MKFVKTTDICYEDYTKQMNRTQDIFNSDLVKTRKDKDSFKPLFCKKEFYHDNLKNFEIINATIENQTDLSTQQKIILWITLLCLLRRPKSWFAGVTSQNRLKLDASTNQQTTLRSPDTNFSLFEIVKKCQIGWPQKLDQNISFFNFINVIKIKPLPEIVLQSLVNIFTHSYPIAILNYEPSPQELLTIQTKSYRIITFEPDFTQWPRTLYGSRDPLSFWLHDCIHAEHFFAHPAQMQMQTGFYRFVHTALKFNFLDSHKLSTEFHSAFNYLISDMNTHPLHLLKTFKAILDIHLNEKSCDVWTRAILANTNNKRQIEALRNMNTSYFSSEDCDVSLQLLKGLGAQSY